MSKKHKGFAPIALLIVLFAVSMTIVAGVVVWQRTGKDIAQTTPKYKTVEEAANTTLDKIKRERLYNLINSISVTYSANRQVYPPGTAAGWENIIDTIKISDAYVDPYTDTLYKFTTEEPDLGYIQYGRGVECDQDRKNFNDNTSDRIIAVRAMFSDGVHCMSNIQG